MGAVEGRSEGLGSGGSRDVVRMGRSAFAGDIEAGGGAICAVGFGLIGRCFVGTGGLAAVTASKLNGRLWSSFGGGSGERGDMTCSLGISGFSVGEGVISGVMVSTIMVGAGGAGL